MQHFLRRYRADHRRGHDRDAYAAAGKNVGAGKVILSEPVEEKRRQAEKLGADLCIDSVKEDLRTALKRADVGRIATVIECVGRKETMSQAIEVAGNKATVMQFGLTSPGEKIELSLLIFSKKSLR